MIVLVIAVIIIACLIAYIVGRHDEQRFVDKPDIRCHCVKDDEFACCMPICNDKENGICAYRFRFDFSEIGKTVFLTREEAERALKER